MRVQNTRRGRTTIAGTCAMAAALAVVVSGCSGGSDDLEGADSIVTPSASPTPSEAASAVEAIDTSDWTTYTSDLYDLEVGHPPGWTETPASRKWILDTDGKDFLSPAHEAFLSPSGHIRVSVWNVPLEPGTSVHDSMSASRAWVEAYCQASGNTPCTGIADRAVELCLEKWDCHPGLLVPFRGDVQAFFSGGIYDADAMTVVAVWRRESAPATTPYGGSQRLLEGFLSTMEVWPASTPRSDRH
jgi:hypothetical protein